ncbi:unnamed protein product [Coffea canephora]|uniref:non-specific serine/threonine protein kinase n=1 Tax=Coffea canephora TaxID=49390 RepID=A0A068VH52_COFCA|nr:unnamed protein product [Coffea canephora]
MWGFRSSSTLANIFLFLLVAMNLSVSHVSASKQFQNETDRLALLEFKNQIYDDPSGVLNSWNHSQHHCRWEGVTCGTRHQRVMALTLRDKHLSGTISPHVGNLSFMRFIQLGKNQFHGEVPQEFGRLFRLRVLNLSSNAIGGKIPANLSYCSELITISLKWNKLEGKIPIDQLSNLKKLKEINLFSNNLTGEIPSSIGNLSSLTALNLDFNHLEGSLPMEMGLLERLAKLGIAANNLSGIIPASIFNSSAIIVISAADNFFHGNLPTNIGLTLPNLEALGFGGNNFYGNFPTSITNASGLEKLDLSRNKFAGQVPANLGDLTNLQYLNLEENLFGGNSTGDLDFIASVMANLPNQLTKLFLGGNQLSGTIPEGFGKIANLYVLGLESNYLSGVIPRDFGKLQNLQFLSLYQNELSGQIVSTLCNATGLSELYLSTNQFEGGNIFDNVLTNCQNLQYLDISQNNFTGIIPPHFLETHSSLIEMVLSENSFTGSLPPEVGKLVHLVNFSVSHNQLAGAIPISLADCSDLENLYMDANFFQGTIPPNLASWKSIQQLDLSSNNLTGPIPRELEKLQYLRYLNLSYNDIEGEIPNTGVFRNASQISLTGNNRLSSKSFKAECKALRNIRHRNLVSIVSYCSSIDSKGDEFKALIYEFMENGNLDLWLHPSGTTDQATSSRSLNLLQKLNIAIDVASTLQYLHDHCETEIVHCDLKPSNILLDNDLVAHVGDFGLARLLPKPVNTSSEQRTSSTVAIKGSIGYAAPEYGMGLAASTQGDVYSYGILLLEMITGRRPTDDIFVGDLDLHNYVNGALHERVSEIVDPLLFLEGDENRNMTPGGETINGGREMECIISLLKIGLKCSARLPNDRMHMNEVVRKLHLIKDVFLGVRVHQENLEA